MITQLFESLGNIITAFASTLSTLFNDVIGLVWNGSAITNFGLLCLIAMGVGLVTWGLNFILRLIRVRGSSRR